MRIVSVNLDGELLDFGLNKLEINRLGPVVALVGPNGSGKTRLLRLLGQQLSRMQVAPYRESWEAEVDERMKALGDEHLKSNTKAFPVLARAAERDIEQEHLFKAIKLDSGERTAPGTPNWLVPRSTVFDLVADATDGERSAAYDRAGTPKFQGKQTLLVLKHVLNRQLHAESSRTKATSEQRTEAIAEVERLNKLVHRLLGTNIGLDLSGNVCVFNHADEELSAGQAILLQFAVALWKQGSRLDDALIFLDEPELHLHPKVLIDVIDRLRAANPKGQLWIATHSIPLIAHLASTDPNCLWYVENGSVSNAGSQPERVLRGLLGDDEKIAQIGDFLREPAVFAGTRFAAECLLPPAVMGASTADQQNNQIAAVLSDLRNRREGKLRLLDYGAGRGRLLAGLREHADLAENVEYFAFDPELHADLKAMVAKEKLFSTHSEFTRLCDQKMDVIVLCNVLHEIEPWDWKSTLTALRENLSDDGFLLLVEDDRMRIGEKAHRFGFVVLPESGVRKLFAIEQAELKVHDGDTANPDRLFGYLVQAKALDRVTQSTIDAALAKSKERRLEQLRELRKKQNPTAADGRVHALLAQQVANIVLVEKH